MGTGTLTDLTVRNAVAKEGKRIEIWDAKLSGFGVRVAPSGTKTFVLLYYMHARKRRMTLGRFPLVTLAEARAKAMKVLGDIAHGIDPELPAREVNYARFRFDDVANEFIEKHCQQHNRASTAVETTRLLQTRFCSVWSGRDIREIKKLDVLAILDAAVKAGTPSAANHALAAVRKLFNWCVERGILESSPCMNIRRPAPAPTRERVLDDVELVAIWNAAVATDYPFGAIVKLLVLTAQRRGEVAGMRWSEIDFEKSLWSIPSNRTKNNKMHVVPLTSMARDILNSLPKLSDSLVFPARGNDAHAVSGFSKMKPRLAAQIEVRDWTLHDLRRTAATTIARLGVAPHVVERILNHSSGTFAGVAGVYNRFEYLPEMRKALEQYEAQLRKLLAVQNNRASVDP